MLKQKNNGVYCPMDEKIHRLKRPYKTNEQQMKSNAGLYTMFGGRWCWVFETKHGFYALIEGKGETLTKKTLAEVEECVRNNNYYRGQHHEL